MKPKKREEQLAKRRAKFDQGPSQYADSKVRARWQKGGYKRPGSLKRH